MAWQDSPEGLSPDWVFSNNSNVHVCNDRRWFTEFTAFPSTAQSPYFFSSQGVPVVGVGIVNLPLKRGPNFRGPRAHLVLRLMEVLYIPSYTCNIIGSTVLEMTREIVTSGGNEKSRGRIIDTNGNQIGYFSPNTKNTSFPCLRLSGPPVGPRLGPSRFKSGVAYFLSIHWPEGERERWRARGEQDKTATEKLQWIGGQPYTAEEKEWLKKHYKGEYKFLMTHGLSIFDEEDRAEGRAIMRTLAKYDESQDKNDEEDDVDDDDDKNRESEEEDEEEDDESDLEGHLADHHFNEEELGWIEKHYRNSAAFMFSHGLKFYDDEHCKTAKRLVQHFLEE